MSDEFIHEIFATHPGSGDWLGRLKRALERGEITVFELSAFQEFFAARNGGCTDGTFQKA